MASLASCKCRITSLGSCAQVLVRWQDARRAARIRNSAAHGVSRADEPARLLESMRAEEVQASAEGIEEKLRLCNVT